MSAEGEANVSKVNVPEETIEPKAANTVSSPALVAVEDSKTTAIESAPATGEDPKPTIEPTSQITSEQPKATINDEPSTTETVTAEPTSEPTQEAAVKLESVKEADAEAAAKLVSTDANDVEKAPSTPQHSVSFDKGTKTHDGSPLSRLFAELPAIFEAAGHNEMWGIVLDPSETHVQTSIVLEKFLRANAKDVPKAKAQLVEALKWRKTMQPQKLLEDTEFDKVKFGNLGYVTSYTISEGRKEIITWNIYGAVKDVKKTFSDVPECVAYDMCV